jgi:hypothetical protein
MEDRIEINGVWYVRENSQPNTVKIELDDVTNSLNCVWESNEFCFDASVILRDNAEDLTDHYGSPYLKITDKRPSERKNWIEHGVDNANWLLGVLEGNPDSMSEAYKMFDENGTAQFRGFISHLIEKGWLIKKII